eukprot:scaffold118091_cov23-Tisochrysis_lutea.AAC.1
MRSAHTHLIHQCAQQGVQAFQCLPLKKFILLQQTAPAAAVAEVEGGRVSIGVGQTVGCLNTAKNSFVVAGRLQEIEVRRLICLAFQRLVKVCLLCFARIPLRCVLSEVEEGGL